MAFTASISPVLDVEEQTSSTAVSAFLKVAGEAPARDDCGDGRGVVILGGGLRYFACAFVCVSLLRRLGCTLPVECWHLGEGEMTPAMRNALVGLGVETVGWPTKGEARILQQIDEDLKQLADAKAKQTPDLHERCAEVTIDYITLSFLLGLRQADRSTGSYLRYKSDAEFQAAWKGARGDFLRDFDLAGKMCRHQEECNCEDTAFKLRELRKQFGATDPKPQPPKRPGIWD